jgi:hypothetical protein
MISGGRTPWRREAGVTVSNDHLKADRNIVDRR